jgi:predicted DNA-binding protein (MmcQ/YjbR family)
LPFHVARLKHMHLFPVRRKALRQSHGNGIPDCGVKGKFFAKDFWRIRFREHAACFFVALDMHQEKADSGNAWRGVSPPRRAYSGQGAEAMAGGTKNGGRQGMGASVRGKLTRYCLTFAGAYEEYPFGDGTAALRHGANRRIFALFLKHGDRELLNLKSDPFSALYWRNEFPSVIPGYHMNKVHWNSVVLDGTVPDDAIRKMIEESYELTGPKIRKRGLAADRDKGRDDA